MEQVTTSESSQLSIIHPGEVMSRTSFFSDLAAEQLERLANSARVVSYKSNESIYELGDPAEDFFILVEGVVRFTIGLGGRRTSAGEIIRCGDVFGWAALIQGAQRRLATSFCLTSSTVLALSGNDMLSLMEEDHTMGYRLMRNLNFLINGKLTGFAAG